MFGKNNIHTNSIAVEDIIMETNNKIYGVTENRVFDITESENKENLGSLNSSEVPTEKMTFDKFKTYAFAWVSGIIMLIGFIYGICAANIYSFKTIETVGTYAPKENVVESLNYPLMWAIWGGTLLLALSFFAVFCILRNQDKIIVALHENKE